MARCDILEMGSKTDRWLSESLSEIVVLMQIVAGLFVFGKVFSYISPGVLGFLGMMQFLF